MMSRPPDNLALDNLGFFAALVLAALARVLVFLSIASSFRSSLGAGSSTMGLIGPRSRSLVEHRRPGGQWRVWLSAPIDRSRDLRATLDVEEGSFRLIAPTAFGPASRTTSPTRRSMKARRPRS